MNEVAGMSAWARFWNRGAWWKAVILAVAYLVLYEAAGFLVTPLLPLASDTASANYILILFAIPIFLGCVILVVFGASVGWLRTLFARERVRGGGWMWIAIVVVLLFNILHFVSIDYGAAGFAWVAAWMLAGLFIGFAEEVLTRGYVVRIIRDSGHSEVTVALISGALFALLHSANLLNGQPLIATAIQLLYTFFFGICMYLALRVTGTIIAPILLHASTDPSIFMQIAYPVASPVAGIANLGNIAVIFVGAILLIVLIVTERRRRHLVATA